MYRSRRIGAMCASFCLMSGFITPVHAIGVSVQGTWETTLQARDLDGNTSTIEGYYDTVLGITWLADANYARTSGYDADGSRSLAFARDACGGLLRYARNDGSEKSAFSSTTTIKERLQ